MSPNRNFEDLRELIPKATILVPGDAGYEDSLKRWSASCVKPAAVVVQPSTASEASVAIRYATANRIYPFAVRGGGHSTSGDCSSDGGMVVDLARMRSTSVDPIAQTITFGGGCMWEDVNGALWEHGLATISGTVGDTGVGGLILGGGYGFITGQHGLALDCLLSCEVVLASGEIVTANKDENADLFWALRGAGVNFGVVTTFVSLAYPQKESWAGFLGFLPDKLPALINFGNELLQSTDGRSMLTVIIGNFLPPENAPAVMAVVFQNGPQEEGERIFQPLLDLKPVVNTTSMLAYTDLNLMFNKTPRGVKDRHLFGGANFTLPLDPKAATEISSLFWSKLAADPSLEKSSLSFEYHPTNKIREVKLADTAFVNRGQYSTISFTMNWTDEEKDGDARALSKMIGGYIAKKVGWKGDSFSDGSGTYLNYISTQTRVEKAFGPNAKRLRELKAIYDPNCLFKKIIDLSPKASSNGIP